MGGLPPYISGAPEENSDMPSGSISVFLADDNLIVREGVRAIVGLEDDLEVVGVSADYAYLLKDRIAEGDQLARAIREVTTGGSMIDPKIVEALVKPVTSDGELTPSEEDLLHQIAQGRPIKAIAVTRQTTAAAVSDDVEALFLKLEIGRAS